MPSELDHTTIEAVLVENRRLRRLAQMLHDYFSPVDCEEFPQHGQEICNVFFMDPAKQNEYWHNEARCALGLQPLTSGSTRNDIVPDRDGLFQTATRL